MTQVSNSQTMSKWLRHATLAVVIWTAIGLVFALPGISAGKNWRMPLLASLAQWWSWGLLAPVIVTVDQLLPFSNKQIVRRVIAHLFLSPIFTAGYIYLFAAVLALMRLGPWSRL